MPVIHKNIRLNDQIQFLFLPFLGQCHLIISKTYLKTSECYNIAITLKWEHTSKFLDLCAGCQPNIHCISRPVQSSTGTRRSLYSQLHSFHSDNLTLNYARDKYGCQQVRPFHLSASDSKPFWKMFTLQSLVSFQIFIENLSLPGHFSSV